MRRKREKFQCQEGSEKKKTERSGQEENIDDMIERPEFILYDVDDLELRDDNIANL